MEPGSRTKLVAVAVLALVFGSGLLLGYAADSDPLTPTLSVATSAESDGSNTEAPRTRRFVYEQLERTPDQDAAIDVIIRTHRHLMNRLHQDFDDAQTEYEATFDALVFETREAIALVFSPGQREEYRHLLAESDQRRERDSVARDGLK